MARYTGPVCRQCRREGEKLFLKGDRCYTDRCAFERRKEQIPGMHWQRRSKTSDYGTQLREKQKAKRLYGVFERQFRGYFAKADRMKGVTGENLLALLERRLDNAVFRMGFAASRRQARQLVRHGHFHVNGRKVDIPSFLVKPGDVVGVREGSRKVPLIAEAMETLARREVPVWVDVDGAKFAGEVKNVPTREEIGGTINEQLIVELYSK
ncbi:MAG: 30S ribosomal protein S4 [Candidatus Lernaella stagnicola]|nr:30S ribosomal protein S4 [Candidatus Lernaella stagnicola]